MTSKNQITLPKAVLAQCPASVYYEVQAEAGRIVLTPVELQRKDADLQPIWDKLEALGITEQDITDAVKWARQQPDTNADAALAADTSLAHKAA